MAEDTARTPQAQPHRCSGCDHRWHAGPPAPNEWIGAELCGDCWRRVQPILHAREQAQHEATALRIEQDIVNLREALRATRPLIPETSVTASAAIARIDDLLHPRNDRRHLLAALTAATAQHRQMFDTERARVEDWEKVAVEACQRVRSLEAQLTQQADEIARLRSALIAHRLDMHMPSSRPCPTCRQSAKALGLTVPEGCARNATDEAALAKLSEGTRT